MTPREPKRDHVTFAFIGGGFAGLVTGARLVEAGVRDVRIIEKGGDFGGTWYWNRYPGRAVRHRVVRVHAAARRDRAHAEREVRARPGDPRALPPDRPPLRPLRPRAVPYRGDGAALGRRQRPLASSAPAAATTSPRSSSAWAPGGLHVPKLPGIPGLETFKGHSFHTSRWDYDYTGGDPRARRWTSWPTSAWRSSAPGATAVQCVPHLARACKELFVFQRTPSSVDVRNNQPTDPAWFAEIATPGLAAALARELHRQPDRRRMADEDLVMDGWTDLARRIREASRSCRRRAHAAEDAGRRARTPTSRRWSEIRARVDAIVQRPRDRRRS